MKLKASLAVAISVAIIITAAAWVRTDPASSSPYPYLPAVMNQPAAITWAEYAALVLTAHYNNTGALTNKLMRQSVRCILGPDGVNVFVDTLTQANWDTHLSGVRFMIPDDDVVAAYQEAAGVVIDWVSRHFPGTPRSKVNVTFSIKGFMIGSVRDGQFRLEK